MELVKRFGIGCVGFLIMYLMCSFYNVTFDISKWSAESRFIATMIGGFSFAMLATFPNYNFKKK
jgi:hypothetical protein